MAITVDAVYTSASGSTSPPGVISAFEAFGQVSATQRAVYFYAMRKVAGVYPTVTSTKLLGADLTTEVGDTEGGGFITTFATGDEGYAIYGYFAYGTAHYGLKLNVDTDPYREVYGAIVASGSGVETWQTAAGDRVISDTGSLDFPTLEVTLDLNGGEMYMPVFLLGTTHANDTSFTNVTTSDPGWTIGDKGFVTLAGGIATRRIGVAIAYYIGTSTAPVTDFSIVRSGVQACSGGLFLDAFGNALSSENQDVLSTVATLDHDLLTGVEEDQHHPKIHALDDEAVHTGGIFYKASASPTISDADFTTPTNGMIAATYDTDDGIKLIWTRTNGTWDAVEATT